MSADARMAHQLDRRAGTDGVTFRNEVAVPDLIVEGSNLLVGPPKLGKSWLALNVGLAIAQGGNVLGSPVDQGHVLYLALEDGGRRLQSRLRIVLSGEPAPERLTLETTCETLTDGGTERIEEWLGDHPDARLVIIDVFNVPRSGERADEPYDADYQAMAVIQDLADRWGVVFLVVDHTRKETAEDFLDTVSGTHGLAGAADAVLVLNRSDGHAEATLKVTGRDSRNGLRAQLRRDIGTWQRLDGHASDYEQSEERRQILAALRESDGLGPKAIADASGVKYDVVKHLVRRMVDAGTLDTDGDGHYSVPRSLHSPCSPFTLTSVNGVNGVNDREEARTRAAEAAD